MTPRVDVDDFLLAVMAASHEVPIHKGRGRRWICITNPVTGAVVRVVACRPNAAAIGRAKAAADAQVIREAAGYVPSQRAAWAEREAHYLAADAVPAQRTAVQ